MSDDAVAEILRKDRRYPRAAYDFVREALAFTAARLPEHRHVTARELLEGLRDHARATFGPLARTVFAAWNVRATQDFGRIVFNLVEAGEMGKTETDRVADFDDVYRFEDAFPTSPDKVEVADEHDEDD